MTDIAMIGDKVLFTDDAKAASGVECCCEGEPCCPCDGNLPPEECALQSITIALDFAELGTCYPDGVQVEFSITEADDDWRNTGSWNKRYTLVDGFQEVRFDAALTCEGGVGPDGANCWAIMLFIQGIGCTMCFTNQIGGFVFRLPGTTQDGICCPAGRTATVPIPVWCDDVSGSITITCVY